MKRIIYCVIISLAFSLGACTQKGEPSKVLCVSIEPQRKILSELVGDEYDVVTVLPPGANPETYEPSVAQRMASAGSEAYFTVGTLPFEAAVAASLSADTRVVDTSEGIVPVMGTHSHGGLNHHEEPDPHVWASVRNGRIIAANMARTLKQIHPENAALYDERLHIIEARLDSIDSEISRRIGESGVKAFAMWHPALSYYARDYGLTQIAVGQESKEVSPAKMRSVIDRARQDSVRVFFFQREFDSRQVNSINREIGSRLVISDPQAYDWENQLINITNELTR